MLDITFAYNRFKFLGDEFLTWLWYVIENDSGYLKNISPDLSSLETGNRIVLVPAHDVIHFPFPGGEQPCHPYMLHRNAICIIFLSNNHFVFFVFI